MKIFILLVVVPLALGASVQKRALLGNLLNLDGLASTFSGIVALVGTDATEQACETACHTVIAGETSVLEFSCPLICHSFQALAQHFGHTPAKRNFLGSLLNLDGLSSLVGGIAAMVGTDETEATCEAACHSIVAGETSVLEYSCPLICHSFQSLAQHFGHTTVTAAPAKRFIFDSFNLDQLSGLVGGIAAMVGTDETEQACESACHTIIAGETSVLEFSCPLVCHSFQTLAQQFGHAPAKRFFVDSIGSLLDLSSLSTLVSGIAAVVGTDETEATCEAACHNIVAGETSVLEYSCPLVCHSFQSLAQHFGPTTAKRALFSGLLNLDGLGSLVGGIATMVGTDATEQACETACHDIVVGEDSVLEFSCPLVCHSFQALAQHFSSPATGTAVGK